MNLRTEEPRDIAAIRDLTTRAFAGAEHSDGTEADIIDRLRRAGALTVSLVASVDEAIVGHVAFSPVEIGGVTAAWFGLGPVAVLPENQRQGIGDALIRSGLQHLRAAGAGGCVVLGEPLYYRRFGFGSDPALYFGDVPAGYFQHVCFGSERPKGEVSYHPAFYAAP